MEVNQTPSDSENGLNTQQATNVQNAQAADNTNGQTPMHTPGAVSQTQATGQTQMQIDVVDPPFRSYVQTPPMHVRATHTGMHGGQNHTSVWNGHTQGHESNVTPRMRIPHFA